MNFNDYIEQLKYGYVSLVFECAILIIALSLFIYFVIRHVTSKMMFVVYAANFILFIVCFIMGLKIGYTICIVMFELLAIYSFIHYIPTIKEQKISRAASRQNKTYLSNQEVKNKLIETLIQSVEFLSNRKVGAIITIEKEHTIDSLVEGAVKLDSEVTFELLETIFYSGTALHDGAVIISGNRIKYASAFYQPTQKKDVPQHYGSRHRAAIGISEQSDAYTIVVSEETGQVAVTIDGTITGNVSLESLRIGLDQNLIVK